MVVDALKIQTKAVGATLGAYSWLMTFHNIRNILCDISITKCQQSRLWT